MPPEQEPTPAVPSATPLPLPATGRRHFPHFTFWIVFVVVVLLLIVLGLPFFGGVAVKGTQSMALSHAKQIGMALKLFAADNDGGSYPRTGLPEMMGAEVKDSNVAFAVLFPQYLSSETIFGNPLSAYQTRPPDNEYDHEYTGKPVKTLEPGENVYAYMAGLTEKFDPRTPLVVDGTDGTGHYKTDAKQRGGVWSGRSAIVVHVDNSAEVEALAGPDDARYIPRHGENSPADKGNLLDVSGLGPDARLLDPAVAHR